MQGRSRVSRPDSRSHTALKTATIQKKSEFKQTAGDVKYFIAIRTTNIERKLVTALSRLTLSNIIQIKAIYSI